MLLLVGVLDEEEQALASLAGPSNGGVSNLGLLATKVLPQVGRWDWLLAEPEVLLSEAESAADMVSPMKFPVMRSIETHFFRPGAL